MHLQSLTCKQSEDAGRWRCLWNWVWFNKNIKFILNMILNLGGYFQKVCNFSCAKSCSVFSSSAATSGTFRCTAYFKVRSIKWASVSLHVSVVCLQTDAVWFPAERQWSVGLCLHCAFCILLTVYKNNLLWYFGWQHFFHLKVFL